MKDAEQVTSDIFATNRQKTKLSCVAVNKSSVLECSTIHPFRPQVMAMQRNPWRQQCARAAPGDPSAWEDGGSREVYCYNP